MTIIKQKTKRQQQKEGWAILAVGVALAIAAAAGVLDDIIAGFF
jgi:hypothetical protein